MAKRGKAAGTQHHASGDRDPAPDIENRHPSRVARLSARSFRAVQVIRKNLAPAWFSPEEYKKLYEAIRKRARAEDGALKWESEQLHDYVLFAANTGLRSDAAWRLQFRDVTIVDDDQSGQTILEIEVCGKRGVGYCKSMSGAVRPYERLKARPPSATCARERQRTGTPKDRSAESRLPEPTDLIFPKWQRELSRRSSTRKTSDSIAKAGLGRPTASGTRTSVSTY
jgi:integrase